MKVLAASINGFSRGRGVSRPLLAVVAAVLLLCSKELSGTGTPFQGELREATVFSQALGKELAYAVYLPPGYASAKEARFPVVYLLHGRGDNMAAWKEVLPDIDRLIAGGRLPPFIAIMPDAPSSRRAGYYIDSKFAGGAGEKALPPGEAVETALTRDLVAHVDATYRTQASRGGRVVGGYSMGGYGALRFALAHPDVFGAAIVLSPAVYNPQPPADSSTREFGAFGSGRLQFDEAVYSGKNYPALLPEFESTGLTLTVFVAVGDDEHANAKAADARHDLDYEAHTLYNSLRRVKGLRTELRVVDGGHNWDVWRPELLEGLGLVLLPAGKRVARP